jgi:hypothetical protein
MAREVTASENGCGVCRARCATPPYRGWSLPTVRAREPEVRLRPPRGRSCSRTADRGLIRGNPREVGSSRDAPPLAGGAAPSRAESLELSRGPASTRPQVDAALGPPWRHEGGQDARQGFLGAVDVMEQGSGAILPRSSRCSRSSLTRSSGSDAVTAAVMRRHGHGQSPGEVAARPRATWRGRAPARSHRRRRARRRDGVRGLGSLVTAMYSTGVNHGFMVFDQAAVDRPPHAGHHRRGSGSPARRAWGRSLDHSPGSVPRARTVTLAPNGNGDASQVNPPSRVRSSSISVLATASATAQPSTALARAAWSTKLPGRSGIAPTAHVFASSVEKQSGSPFGTSPLKPHATP